MSKKISILIYRIGSLGDTLVTLPAIDYIKKSNPNKKIFLLTNYNTSTSIINSYTIYNELNYLDGVIKYDINEIRTLIGLNKLKQELQEIRDFEFYNLNDKVFKYNIFQRFLTKLFFRYIINPVKIYNFNFDFNQRHPQHKNDPTYFSPEWFQILNFIKPNGLDFNYNLEIPIKYCEKGTQILKRYKINILDSIIVISPGSKMKSKLWPKENYIKVLTELTLIYPQFKFILIGDKSDNEICNFIKSKFLNLNNIINLAGECHIYETAYIISISKFFIGSDSGPMHFAGLLKIPCVALFSSRDVKGRWEPFGFNHSIIRKEISCQYCLLEICPNDNACLRNITPYEVLEKIIKYLN